MWYLLGVKIHLSHAHQTRFWYILGCFSKIADEHLRHFYMGVRTPGLESVKDKQRNLSGSETILEVVKRFD